MGVDLDRLAELVRGDRGRRSQKKYAPILGVKQAQVSRLEKRRISRLSADLASLLEGRLGPLPQAGETPPPARHLHRVVLEVASVAPISAKDRGLLLSILHDLVAILRADPDKFRLLQTIAKSYLPPEP